MLVKFFTRSVRRYRELARPVKDSRPLIRARDARIAVRITGAGPAVLLVHGLTGSSWVWRRVLPSLARGHTVVAPDLPSRGRSPGRPELRYRLRDEVDRLRALLDRLGLDSVTVVGHSHGAALAVALAATGSETAGLVLVNPVTPWTPRPPALSMVELLPGAAAVAGGFSRLLAEPVTRWTLRRRVFTGVADPAPCDVRAFARPFRDPGRARALPAILGDWNPSTLGSYLGAVPAGGRVLAGEHDRRTPPRRSVRLARALEMPVEVIPEAGHAVPLERPADVVRALGRGAPDAGPPGGDPGADHGSSDAKLRRGGGPSG